MHLDAGLANDACRAVDLDVAERHRRGGVASARALVAAHVGAHAGEQLRHAERLFDVVVGAGVEGAHLVFFVGARRKHDHRHLRPGAQLANQIGTVAVGQTEVGDDEVGPARRRVDQALLDRLGLEHAPAFGLERGANEAPDVAVVFDQQ